MPTSETSPKITRKRLFALVALPLFAIYAFTSARHYIGGDHGIFAAVFNQGGFGHPPGYPVWSAFVRAMSWIPGVSGAHGSSLATALVGAAAFGVMALAIRDWTGRSSTVVAGVGLTAFSSHVWYMHTHAEVFAMHHLVVALFLWALAPRFPLRGRWRGVAAGLAFAFGVAHHHTIIWFVPCFVASLVVARREGANWGWVVAGFVSPLLGLIPYAYLPLSLKLHPEALHWGDVTTLPGMLDNFFRRQYGTFAMAAGGEGYPLVDRLRFFGVEVSRDLLWVGGLLTLGGAIAGFFTASYGEGKEQRDRRWVWLAVVVSLLFSGPLFALLLHRVPDGVGHLLLRKFHVSFQFAAALPIAMAVAWIVGQVGRQRAVVLASVALVSLQLALGLGRLQPHQSPAPEHYAHDLLTAAPDGGVLIGTGDHTFIGILYLHSEGVRPEVPYVEMNIVKLPWYRAYLEESVEIPRLRGPEDSGRLIELLRGEGRSVLLTEVLDESVTAYPIVPRTPALLVGEPQPLPIVLRDNVARLEELRLRPRAHPSNSWGAFVQKSYEGRWRELASALERAGLQEAAARADAQAEFFDPSQSSAQSE